MVGIPTYSKWGPVGVVKVRQYHRDWLEAGPWVPKDDWDVRLPDGWPRHITPSVLLRAWSPRLIPPVHSADTHLAGYLANHPRADKEQVELALERLSNRPGFWVYAYNIHPDLLGFCIPPISPRRRHTYAVALRARCTDPINVYGPRVETYAFGYLQADVRTLPRRAFDIERTAIPDHRLTREQARKLFASF